MWQMMRGSIIIITALLKRGVLGHKLKKHMWMGVGVITVAMLVKAHTAIHLPIYQVTCSLFAQLVASTSFFSGSEAPGEGGSSSKDPRVGILLVLVGCMAQGVQCTLTRRQPQTAISSCLFFPRRVRGEGDGGG